MSSRSRGRALLGAVALLLVVTPAAACAGSADPVATGPSASVDPTVRIEYSPGLTEDLYLPRTKGRVPLVVMVPGGSWTTADPAGFAGLAGHLAGAGVAAATAHIRAAEDGVRYPVPLEDVLCAVAAAAAKTRARGFTPGPVTVLGHSSGAHLAALAVLAVDDYAPTCTSPPVRPDALVGLSGPYDISQLPDLASALLGTGPDEDPATWEAANPVHRADLRPDVPVLLLHGEDDTTVPVAFTEQFASALEEAGHPTTVQVVPGADHLGIFQADASGDRIARWVLALPSPG